MTFSSQTRQAKGVDELPGVLKQESRRILSSGPPLKARATANNSAVTGWGRDSLQRLLPVVHSDSF